VKNERLIAYVLIAVGVITLLTRIGSGADWLWVGLVAAAFLAGYVTRKNYGFLVAGSILMGIAVGLVFPSQSWFFISLAVGFFMIDRIEPRPNRWPFYFAGVFAVLGVFSGLSETGLLGSFGFALLLIAAGAYLLLRDQKTPESESAPPRSEPVTPSASASSPPETASTTRTTPTGMTPTGMTPTEATSPRVVTPPPASTDTGTGATTTTEATTRPATPEAPLAPEVAEPELSPEEKERLRRLEAWRRETAAAEGVPAYIVLRNESLEQIAVQNPRTLEALDKIKGIGPVKLERYGEAILKTLHGDTPARV